jgi:hypothetical protein
LIKLITAFAPIYGLMIGVGKNIYSTPAPTRKIESEVLNFEFTFPFIVATGRIALSESEL